ncbi:hypothetical protein T484DRAFT_1975762 [Baffinella frigidus]|nr:hypothetical protein T484DRAFT_1975762 [Cryptophyta sp. CCMP2293]
MYFTSALVTTIQPSSHTRTNPPTQTCNGVESTHPHVQRRRIYRGTSLIRNRPPLGPYTRPMPRALRWS